MKTLYIISCGEYSDYDVKCACLTQELAEQVKEKLGDRHEVGELPLFESITDTVDGGLVYRVITDLRGNEIDRSCHIADGTYKSQVLPPRTAAHFNGEVRGYSRRGYDVALKICHDILAKHLAQQMSIA